MGFTIKKYDNNEIVKCKARLIAEGFQQNEYEERGVCNRCKDVY